MHFQLARYAPMNHSHILGFPNRMPCIDWQTYFPKFKNEEGNDATPHLIKIHMHIHKLGVKFKEYFLMKMFMATLEGKQDHGMKKYRFLVYTLYKILIQHSIRKLQRTLPIFFTMWKLL